MKKSHHITKLAFLLVLCTLLCGCAVSGVGPGREDLPSTMPQDRYVQVNGLRYHYTEFPAPGEKVFLLHGFGSSTASWERVAPLLQKQGLHVYALDMMGFGYSDKPRDRAYDPVALTDSVNEWLDAMDLHDVTFVGNSLGGGIGMLMTQRHPDKIKRLVAVDPAVPYPEFKLPFVIWLASLPGVQYVSQPFMCEFLIKTNLQYVYYDKSKLTPTMLNAYMTRMQLPGAAYAMSRVANASHPQEFLPMLDHIANKKPEALILWGANDPWIPLSCAYKLKKDLPFAKLCILPECGHAPQEEKPVETAALIADFITGKPVPEATAPVNNM